MVRQLGNGRAVSSTGRRVRQPLRGTCTHARASTRAHAPTVHGTLQHTFPQHCTSTTTAHSCMCKLTCPYRSGASGRGGRCWARHGWAPPISGHREPLRGLQPPQHHAAERFAAAVQNGGWGVSRQRWSIRAARDNSFMLRWPWMPARRPRGGASAAHERVASRALALCLLVEVV